MPVDVIPKIPQTEIAPPNPLDEQEALTYVNSWKLRTGDVTPQANDYSASQVANDSTIPGGHVDDALDYLLGYAQPLDPALTSIAGLATSANQMLYTTASDTYAVTSLTAFARSLLDDADAPTARATLDAVGGRSALTQNTILKADASGDAVDSSITDDGSTVVIGGNLTVTGTTTLVDSTTVAVGDSLFKYAKDNTSTDIIDIGWYGVYGPTPAYTGMFRDASDGKFKLYSGLQVEPTTTVNIAGAGYSQATLVAGLESDSVTITGGTINGVTYDSLQLNTAAGTPSHSEGLIFYDATNKTLAFYNDEVDSTMQVGQELWVRVKNNTGVTITNGQVVYLNGQDSGIPTVALADADLFTSAVPTLGFATHDIETGTIGLITAFGTVRNLDTSGCSPGDSIYLSTTPGEFTNTAPGSPAYKVRLGSCVTSNATTGTVEVSVNPLSNTDDIINFWNGSILEDHTILVSSDGLNVSISLEKSGGGDLNLFFNGSFSPFDSTPAASVNLTAGSDTAPTRNYIYIPESTGVLTASTSGFPDTQHVPVADVICQSASTVQTEGAYKVHAWTDHLASSNDQGHLSHINYWIRNQHATYVSGVAPTFSGSGTGTVGLATTSGVLLQLHNHTFPAFSDPAEIFVVNDSTTPYTKITNIHDIDTDSTGASLNNSTFGIVIWGVVSEDESDCKLYVNLPSGSYGAGKPDLVREDVSQYQNFTIPGEYKGCAFLLYRLVVSRNAGGTASTLYTGGSGDDLRGVTPGSGVGGSAAGTPITDFSDNQFTIFNVTDNTKEIDFDASAITTGNTRTITMADRDIDLAASVLGYSNLTTQYRIPYVNSTGTLTESTSILTDANGRLGVGASPSYRMHVAGTSQNTVMLGIVGSSLASNDTLVYANGGTVTGSINGLYTFGSASTGFNAKFENQNNSSATAHSRFEMSVNGASAGDPKMVFTVSGVLNWATGVDNSDSDTYKISKSDSLGTNDYFEIDTSGNVGIGTTPSYKLHVSGNGYFSGDLFVGGNNINLADYTILSPITTNANADVRIQGNGTGFGYLRLYDQDDAELLQLFCQSGDGNIQLAGTDPISMNLITGGTAPIVFKPAGSEKMRIDSSGNVGIGKTPGGSYRLDVSGDVYANGFYDCATAKGLKVNGTQVVTDQQSAMTAQLTSITHTAPGTPDYAIQNLTNTSPYGFATQDEGNTVLSVIANLQTRVAELETKLQAHGLIA